ncbi:MAG: hypothetical protein ACLFQS_11820 [Bacteroidales bacterium]
MGSKKVTGAIIEVQRTGAITQQYGHSGRSPSLFQPSGNALGYRELRLLCALIRAG